VVEVALHMALVRAIKLDGTVEMFRQGGARVKRSAGTASVLRHLAGANSWQIEATPIGGVFHSKPACDVRFWHLADNPIPLAARLWQHKLEPLPGMAVGLA
jgi:hypothetical protein